jgi:urease accessory protein
MSVFAAAVPADDEGIPVIQRAAALPDETDQAPDAGETKPSLTIAAALVAFFAVFHGHAHGTEMPAGQSGLAYSIGFVVATGCLHATGIAVGLVHKWPAGRTALRAAGVAVAIAGLGFLWRAVA